MTMSTETRRIRIILSREFPRIIQMGMGLKLRGVTEEGHKNNIRMKVMKRRMMRMSQSQGTVWEAEERDKRQARRKWIYLLHKLPSLECPHINWSRFRKWQTCYLSAMRRMELCVLNVNTLKHLKIHAISSAEAIASDISTRLAKINSSQSSRTYNVGLDSSGSVRTVYRTLLTVSVAKRRGLYYSFQRKESQRQQVWQTSLQMLIWRRLETLM